MSSLKYFEGELKKRPNIYNRYSNAGESNVAEAVNGIGAIAIKASWGPLNEVKKFTGKNIVDEVALSYGDSAGSKAAQYFAKGGLNTLYVYRCGTGGTYSTLTLDSAITISAKYVGTRTFSVTVRDSITDDGKKELLLLDGATVLQKFVFTSTAKDLADAIGLNGSEYITAKVTTEGTEISNVANEAMTAGTDATVTTTDYSTAFSALEPYDYTVLTIDADDQAVRTLLANYAVKAEELGKRLIASTGTNNDVKFDERCTEAKGYNAANVCFCGSGYIDTEGNKIGKESGDTRANAIMAGYIASSPTTGSVVHQQIAGAVDVVERLSHTDYTKAIENGLILLSVGSGGQVWFDSGVNTLINPSVEQDEGWKKIKRVKTRYELFDRIDRTLEPYIGNINAGDTDLIIQLGQKVISAMVQEGKLISGTMTLVSTSADSNWYDIEVIDPDTLEKIYLHYKFRYSQEA